MFYFLRNTYLFSGNSNLKNPNSPFTKYRKGFREIKNPIRDGINITNIIKIDQKRIFVFLKIAIYTYEKVITIHISRIFITCL